MHECVLRMYVIVFKNVRIHLTLDIAIEIVKQTEKLQEFIGELSIDEVHHQFSKKIQKIFEK